MITQRKKKIVIGLMSGTSANGIDAAIVEITGCGINSTVSLIDYSTYPYEKEIKDHIFQITNKAQPAKIFSWANFYLGKLFGEAALLIAKKAAIPISEVDLIGSHGQTICHLPSPRSSHPFCIPSTMQIGEPAVIAELTGVKTVADFRTADMAAGGIGAPLTPYANYILFRDPKKNRIIQNIGGISNLTVLKGGTDIKDTISFDSGPGNMIIDAIISKLTKNEKEYDENGDFASRGKVDKNVLEKLLTHPYFDLTPPKSTGREDFGHHFSAEIYGNAKNMNVNDHDTVATITAFTAESIVRQYSRFVFPECMPDEVILCGGGVYNKTLTSMIKDRLPGIKIVTSAKYNIPPCALEAVSFAILAHNTVNGLCNNIPRVTGADHPVILGKVVS